ncbi:MAG: hypothetical protein KJZ91_31175, partial [Myxococcales bacterium]|nr:hypothetical protein [Myxococcales bacterium]
MKWPLVMLIGTVVGATSTPAEGQPCPAVPPCGACVEDVGSATCKPRSKPKHTARAISLSAHWSTLRSWPPRSCARDP